MEFSSFNEIICPFNTEWKFHRADLMDLVDTENDFALKDFENEYLKGKFYYAYFYLFLVFDIMGSNGRKISAECTISVKSANFSRNFNDVYDKHSGYGAELCKTKKFFDLKSKYFVDGEITIKVEGILKAEHSLIPIISAPISMEWKIKEYDLKVKMEESDNGDLFSETVVVSTFPEVSYYLSFTPNRIKDANESMAEVYLHVEFEKEEKIEAVYDFCIDSVNYRDGCKGIFEPETCCGNRICSTANLFDPSKKFMVDGVLTIDFNGILMVERDQYLNLNCKNDIATKSALKGKKKDFPIIIGNKKIRVHKQVLKSVSPVWAEKIDSQMKEYIRIEDFSSKIVCFAVTLLYGVLINLSMENMLSLYLFAQKYRIQILLDFIEEQLIKEISPAIVVHLFKFSSPETSNIPNLHQKCINYFMKCLKETIPIYAVESLGETFLASMVLKSLNSNFTDTNV
uniref:BTB domain-containing protein n=1 Tax=Panagrolaimus davidi TaxID=227884 RepID=A0A914PQB7_9BILA